MAVDDQPMAVVTDSLNAPSPPPPKSGIKEERHSVLCLTGCRAGGRLGIFLRWGVAHASGVHVSPVGCLPPRPHGEPAEAVNGRVVLC